MKLVKIITGYDRFINNSCLFAIAAVSTIDEAKSLLAHIQGFDHETVLKAICLFYEVYIAPAVFANLVLSVENNELGISAGLQDRVAQAFEKPVFMNFERKIASSVELWTNIWRRMDLKI